MRAEPLLSLGVSVAAEQNVEAVLDSIVRGLAAQAGIALARIWLLRPGDLCDSCFMGTECRDRRQCLHLVASAGSPINSAGEDWSFLNGHFRRMPMNARKVGVIAATGTPVLLKDSAPESEWTARPDWAKREEIRAFAGYPLIFRGNCLGVLALFSREPLNEQEFFWLRMFADQAAVAIANAQAFQDRMRAEAAVQRSEARLRALLSANNAIITNLSRDAFLDAVSETLRQVLTFDFAAIAIYYPETDAFRFLAVEGQLDHMRSSHELKREGSSAGCVFERRAPLIRQDLEKEQEHSNEQLLAADGMRSLCTVPLTIRDRCTGVLTIASKSPDLYGGEDAQFLQEIANQIALALENMKSYEEIAALKAQLEMENVYLQEEIRREHDFDEIVGNSPVLLQLLRKVDMVASSDSTVLLLGETGTGKELIARAIHARGPRKGRPLVKVNCGSIPAGLVESELFGHVKGAFTGATANRVGRFELANKGSLFLDEVGELTLDTQVKLLRVLQEQEFEPVGSSRTVRVDVRVIAATNRDLEKAIQTGAFRSDLYYRLNVLPLAVPALRERRSDIPQLVAHFLDRFSKKTGKTMAGVSTRTMESLVNYSWPGNIREMQNVIERGVVLSQNSVLDLGTDVLPAEVAHPSALSALNPETSGHAAPLSPVPDALEEVERHHILAVLDRTRWVINGPRGAAAILGMHPSTLRSRMAKLGIVRHGGDISK